MVASTLASAIAGASSLLLIHHQHQEVDYQLLNCLLFGLNNECSFSAVGDLLWPMCVIFTTRFILDPQSIEQFLILRHGLLPLEGGIFEGGSNARIDTGNA